MRAFAKRIVTWQRVHGRNDLPWQRDRDPYRIWVSEIMLQQTQVSTVIPGAKSVEQALDNFAAADKQLSPEVVQSMVDLWEREIMSDPLPW